MQNFNPNQKNQQPPNLPPPPERRPPPQYPNQPPGQYPPPAQPVYPPRPQQGQYPPQPPANGQPVPPKRRYPLARRSARLGWMPGPGCILGCAGVFSAFAIVFLIATFLVYYSVNQRLEERIEELDKNLSNISDPGVTSGFETTFIYDRNQNKLYEVFGQGRRRRIELSQMPENVLWATISVEDDDFYSNPGVDIKSNIRAILQYFQQGAVVSGGSTITQQLVRNVLFDPEYRTEQSIQRKLDEISLSLVLTQERSKDEILELYLNEIYYGNLAYGIEAASQTYFGKPASELQLHEAALLAGLPQSPSQLDPLNPDPFVQGNVIERQHLVLDLMVKEEYITEAEAEAAKQAPLNYVSPDVPLEAPHFTLYAKRELENLLTSLGYPPEFINDGGLRVYTTIDLQFQDIAQRAAENTVRQLRDRHNLTNSAVVVIHPPSGEILAMVGSVDYNDDSIDGQVNVAISQRQPGSTIKPFTYAAALEQGWTAGTIIWDVRTNFGVFGGQEYIPDNYDNRFHGPMRLRDALANSYNIPAVDALRYIGVDYLVSYMHRNGVQSLNSEPGRYGLALTLGGGEVTLLEMTNGFANFARGGIYVPPTSILCIIDRDDNIIYQYEGRCPQGEGNLTSRTHNTNVSGVPIMDPRIAFIISDILADNGARTPAMGANSPLNTGDLLTSVKTGTTNDFKDNWTVGFTHDVAVGVWSGNSSGAAMNNISGLAGAAPIWSETIQGIYRSYPMPPSVLQAPPGVSQRRICNVRAMREASIDCPTTVEWFLDSAPLVPDGQGNLVEMQGVQQPQPTPLPEFGPRLIEREPGIWETVARRLDPNQANILLSQNPGLQVPPQFCLVPIEVVDAVADEQNLLFIAPPLYPQDQPAAYQYAINAGIPILPQAPCTLETINVYAPVAPGAIAQIVSPSPGQTVSGNVPIYGVVNYPDGSNFTYYKLEVRGGQFADWTTLGDVHYNEVLEPNLLETFTAGILPPGYYELRLWVQGDLYVEPHVVPINLVSP